MRRTHRREAVLQSIISKPNRTHSMARLRQTSVIEREKARGIEQGQHVESVFVALDVETTGLQAGTDEIIEIAAVRFRGETVEETFQRLIKPRYSLPIKIAQLTGINAD